MLTIEELLDAGVVLLDEQIDFFHHPEGRLAVAVYGVPDPDRLYISGLDREATIYQRARDGEPADENGYAACVIPVVLQAGDQDESARIIADYEGDVDNHYPVVHGSPWGASNYMWRWSSDEVPISVVIWDLWPISPDELSAWGDEGWRCVENSAIPPMFELIENYNGSEYYGEDYERIDELQSDVANRLYALEKKYQGHADQDAELESLHRQQDILAEQKEKIAEDYIGKLEQAILHPDTGDVDAQMPPVVLPSEQAAIWRSLQSLSWRNWSALEKEDPTGSSALYGNRFVQANRRLCPWY